MGRGLAGDYEGSAGQASLSPAPVLCVGAHTLMPMELLQRKFPGSEALIRTVRIVLGWVQATCFLASLTRYPKKAN